VAGVASGQGRQPGADLGTYAALGEGLALGGARACHSGLVEALGGGAAGSWILQNRSGNVIRGSHPLGFRMELHLWSAHRPGRGRRLLRLPMEVTWPAEQAQRLVANGCGGEDPRRSRGSREIPS
jgi:3-hydroxyisobutyrate dehydrogenase-like beta-hydroxyacid dehydrogenase